MPPLHTSAGIDTPHTLLISALPLSAYFPANLGHSFGTLRTKEAPLEFSIYPSRLAGVQESRLVEVDRSVEENPEDTVDYLNLTFVVPPRVKVGPERSSRGTRRDREREAFELESRACLHPAACYRPFRRSPSTKSAENGSKLDPWVISVVKELVQFAITAFGVNFSAVPLYSAITFPTADFENEGHSGISWENFGFNFEAARNSRLRVSRSSTRGHVRFSGEILAGITGGLWKGPRRALRITVDRRLSQKHLPI
ncbi:hypothetical protein KM043_003626 [Ampulex compressa]|nr:hypothetical protein KM043_003626 [Ampulex compressa]